jgi:putative membrane protein
MLIAIVICAPGVSGYSQSSPPQGGKDGRSQTTTSPQTGATRPDNSAPGNASPIATLIEMNNAEVEVGKMASSKAQNSRVKQFAEMMVKEHTQALTKIRSLKSGASPDVKPNAKHEQTRARLAKLSGAEFDREYMNAMVSDHQEAVRFLEQQIGGVPAGNANASATGATRAEQGKAGVGDRGRDRNERPATNQSSTAGAANEVPSLARELLPAVRQHLQMAQQIEKELQGGTNTKGSDSSPSNTGRSNQAPDPNLNKK